MSGAAFRACALIRCGLIWQVGYRNGKTVRECLDSEQASDPTRLRFDDTLSKAQKEHKKLNTEEGLHWTKSGPLLNFRDFNRK